MKPHSALLDAARWTMREDPGALDEAPPPAARDVQAMLDDPALSEALAELASMGRLSDAEVRAMRKGAGARSGRASLALVAAMGITHWRGDWQRAAAPTRQHFETRRGEQRTVQLADGSTLQLDGATAIDVEIGASSRRVALQREAYFDVAHDASRPFEVRAGHSNTRVLGTAFTLDVGSRGVKLAVYRGKVQFGGHDAQDGNIVVPAGWRSRYSGNAAQAPSRFDATQQDWRQAWIDTNDLQLGELVDALNRRKGPEILRRPRLASIVLAGRFRLDNPQQLLGAMGEVYGFHVKAEGNQLRLEADPGDVKTSSN